MTESLGSRNDLHEGTELRYPGDFALIDLSRFGLLDDTLDDANGFFRGGLIDRSDPNGSIVFNINLNAGLLDNAPYDLTARAYHLAHLGRLDFDGENPGGKG